MSSEVSASPLSYSNASVNISSYIFNFSFNGTYNDNVIPTNNYTLPSRQAEYLPDIVYYLIGIIMTLVFILGFVANAAILFVYTKNHKLRTVNNVFVIGLSLSDFGQTVFNIPLLVISSFNTYWVFGDLACLYYAFVTTGFGITQIALLTVIAVERYFVIVRHSRKLSNTMAKAILTIVSCFIFGFSWASAPLLGWSKYEMEAARIACCVSWNVKSINHLSYTMSLFTFGWFIPITLISFGYSRIAKLVYSERLKKQALRGQGGISRNVSRERKVAITVLIMIGAFVISWMPYSIVSLLSALLDEESMPTGLMLVPSIFAKSSIIWNPIIYVARHTDFRRIGFKTLQTFSFEFFCCKETSSATRPAPCVIETEHVYTYKVKRLPFVNEHKYIQYSSGGDSYDNSGTSTNKDSYSSTNVAATKFASPAVLKREKFKRCLTTSTDTEPLEHDDDILTIVNNQYKAEGKETLPKLLTQITSWDYEDKCPEEMKPCKEMQQDNVLTPGFIERKRCLEDLKAQRSQLRKMLCAVAGLTDSDNSDRSTLTHCPDKKEQKEVIKSRIQSKAKGPPARYTSRNVSSISSDGTGHEVAIRSKTLGNRTAPRSSNATLSRHIHIWRSGIQQLEKRKKFRCKSDSAAQETPDTNTTTDITIPVLRRQRSDIDQLSSYSRPQYITTQQLSRQQFIRHHHRHVKTFDLSEYTNSHRNVNQTKTEKKVIIRQSTV